MNSITIAFWVSLILFIFLLWKWYWRLQIVYNSSALSLFTPDSFVIPEDHKERYFRLMETGKIHASQSTIVICALLRDVESKLPSIEKKMEHMGELFKDYKLLIVENDSADHTREYLIAWQKRNPRVVILGCAKDGNNNVPTVCHMDFPKTDGHTIDKRRIEKMVHLRNIYLQELKANYTTFDYAIFWDLDIIGAVYHDGVWNTMGYFAEDTNSSEGSGKAMTEGNIALICAYGIYRWGLLTLYYDTYGHIDTGEDFHIDNKLMHDIKKGISLGYKYNRGDDLVEVDSCFSGFTIYRIQELLPPSIMYDMSPDDKLECEHVRLHMKIKKRKVMNPAMIHFLLQNE